MPRLCSGEDSHRQADKNVRLRRMLAVFFAKTRMATSRSVARSMWGMRRSLDAKIARLARGCDLRRAA
jgi:hypothetical protein